MKDQLIAALGERAGLDEAKASQVVDVVLDFLKKNPDKVTDLLGEGGAGSVTGSLGKLFKR